MNLIGGNTVCLKPILMILVLFCITKYNGLCQFIVFFLVISPLTSSMVVIKLCYNHIRGDPVNSRSLARMKDVSQTLHLVFFGEVL